MIKQVSFRVLLFFAAFIINSCSEETPTEVSENTWVLPRSGSTYYFDVTDLDSLQKPITGTDYKATIVINATGLSVYGKQNVISYRNFYDKTQYYYYIDESDDMVQYENSPNGPQWIVYPVTSRKKVILPTRDSMYSDGHSYMMEAYQEFEGEESAEVYGKEYHSIVINRVLTYHMKDSSGNPDGTYIYTHRLQFIPNLGFRASSVTDRKYYDVSGNYKTFLDSYKIDLTAVALQ
jgi:hypothetical protein